MYNLIVSQQFNDWDEEAFRFDKSRYLEYTSESIKEQLRLLSIEAIECIKSWPCLLMEEGRAEEIVRIARIMELQDLGGEFLLTVHLYPSKNPILNDHLWRIRDKLDIEQFEFSRNHWAIKDRDLFSGLGSAIQEFDTSIISCFEAKPLPAPTRASLLKARNTISKWSHSDIDDLLLEAGVENLSAGRDIGSRHDRANAIVRFVIENPAVVTAENSLFSVFIISRASIMATESEDETKTPLTQESAPVISAVSKTNNVERSPNRVFVVHGQNDTARTEVVSFLESIGLVGIVLHEQPNMGRHLLTKFMQEAELVTFAVVLMTDDDVGSLRGENLAPRARQNVILELGYFLSYLGQAKVCALITPGLETPSDFDGIAYINMDDKHRWQQELKRELLAARMPVVDVP